MYFEAPSNRPTPFLPPLGETVETLRLGPAIFSEGKPLVTKGNFSSEANVVDYIHQPPSPQLFRPCTTDFSLRAYPPDTPGFTPASQPRKPVARAEFWFRLAFEYNGNDLRNISIVALVDRSTRASTFFIRFDAKPLSERRDPVASVGFDIFAAWPPGNLEFHGSLTVDALGGSSLRITHEDYAGRIRQGGSVIVRQHPAHCAN